MMKSRVDLRMKRAALCVLFFVVLACSQVAGAQTRRARAATPYGLHAGALVVETRALELGGAKRRALVLWMLRPKKYPRDAGEEIYTCPEETRGSFYRGPARVSLVDTEAGRVVNTLNIVEDNEDVFD